MNIMIIEDQRDVVEMLRLNWSDSRDRLDSLASVRQANRFIHSNELAAYDCILIDINLTDGSGLELLRDARSRSDVPIIMISGAGDADSRADAISVGADDYVMKPFSVKELRARVHRLHDARLSRVPPRQGAAFKIGNIDCDIAGLSLDCNGASQPLTALEARILQVLHDKAGDDCPKSCIARQALFREHDPRDKTIDVYINRLRGKLAELDPASGHAIKTIRGVGYRMSDAPR
ncbi:response regulator transcription factor [Neorhizobium galegae]|uniref:response regulator transcription factor n=1 Tax=Neorhizobium galegae TaxID=399 RepID=UPI000627931D|nr:response regulator transcription factor [Neorhizobium galegae]KAA9383560.1 response regulator transcription factor [Neorhizobium galegae]KAB1111692.1 response regulator transcription factor [Neorhizobium galegae]MCM2500759.1 response regulator transcription factor [Neorhizobium galegae]MCQ1768418.1 response regulator transcription factor [Neorhizobium galegae]MCQ1769773.1 response regulator transcription factor [Neorhizobium galegae]